MTLSLAVLAAVTPPLAVWQILALKTGLVDRHRVPRLWHRLALRLIGIRVTVHGRIDPARPLLIAANHVSWSDIVVLGASANLHFIARADLASWPIVGHLARMHESVFVDRRRRGTAGLQAASVAARLAQGDPMVLFAEGTTGDGNRILPFNSTLFGAARLAIAADADGEKRVRVQPVAIAYTRRHGMAMGRRERAAISWIGDQYLGPHIRALFAGGPLDVELRFGDAIDFSAVDDRKEIARKAEEAVRLMLQEGRAQMATPPTAASQRRSMRA